MKENSNSTDQMIFKSFEQTKIRVSIIEKYERMFRMDNEFIPSKITSSKIQPINPYLKP